MPLPNRKDQTRQLDKELEKAAQLVKDNFGADLGHYVPGLSLEAARKKSPLPSPTSAATAAAPPAAASEASQHDFSDFEQFKDFDRSARTSLVRSTSPVIEDVPTRKRRPLSARSYSKDGNTIEVKIESDEEAPPRTDTTGWLPVVVNSPTSPAEEADDNKVRSPSFEPDFSGGDETEIIHDREDQTSPKKKASSSSQMFATFMERWGKLSWLVDYTGPYDNIVHPMWSCGHKMRQIEE